ncbi:oxidoreductase [Mycobacterium sp. IEC1808]|uniref:oxidoreductase n=1 Tax=Mycobacterium sp. IEC1808 TaxID=1743230 RepID=UPI001F4D6818|nr:oxidoreductase [Mycobacterium sp. IEC1808]
MPGYARTVGFLVESWPESWHRSRVFRVLSLGGYVAFNLPRVVTGLGAILLVGVAATHAYALATQATRDALPWYFVVYAVAVIAGCLLVGLALWVGRNHHVAQAGWYFGSLLSVVVIGVDVLTRVVYLPALTGMTGRWDFAPASFAFAFAGAFLALHTTVLLGINVAYPQRQRWED